MPSTSTMIHKIGAIILRDKKILVVRKNIEGRTEYIIPGGRPEGAETHLETLQRELREELQVTLTGMSYFGSFEETALFENIPIHMDVYHVRIAGQPHHASEIKEYIWIDRNYDKADIRLGTVLSKHVIPRLTELRLM